MDKHHDSDFEKNHNSKQKGFFSFVFEYNEDKKTRLIKIGQYVTLGFIFYSTFIHIINKYFPKIDDSCSSIEIIITLLLYCYIYFYSLYYIDRIRCYLSSIFSSSHCIKHDERDLSEYDIVTPALLAILSFNPQFQDGMSIIFERISEAWNGNEKKQKKKKKSEQQQQQQQQQPVSHTPITSSLYSGNTTPINQLPILQEGFTQQQPVQHSLQQSLQQIHSPEEVNAPLAANEVVGGSFGSLF
jgi:hypothetical protein